MKSKNDLKREYKERRVLAGIFRITNLTSSKVLLGSSLNIEGPLNRHRFMLQTGMHPNKELQEDWNEFGPDAFKFEIVETVKPSDKPGFCLTDELTLLEQIWIEDTEPFGEKGYNTSENIRQA